MQIANILGFEIFATAGEKNLEYVKGLGAKEVFDYKDLEMVEKIMKAAEGNQVLLRCHFYERWRTSCGASSQGDESKL